MDTYENMNPEEQQEQLPCDILPEEPVVNGETEEQTAQEEVIPAAKRVSPYADSPYVMNHPVQESVKSKRAKKKENKNKKSGFLHKPLCAVLAVVILAGACVAGGVLVNAYWEDRMENMEDSFESRLEQLEQSINKQGTGTSVSGSPVVSVDGLMTPAQVYAKNAASVVMIYNEITTKYNGQISTGIATGSGFILTEDGYVVTNHHVIEGGGTLSIELNNGSVYSATLIGSDETNDVALLKVDATGLPAVTLGKSSDLIVGDQVVAIGNPLGELTSTLTVGYISAKERDVNTDGFAINMLQTDAAINSGNSGGPLFNMRGEVVGITTAKYSGTSSSGASIEGIGFAIPIDDVVGLLADLATYGYIKSAYLGVSVHDMDAAAADYYGMPVGAYVLSVEEGSAADRAGIQPKDIITSLGDDTVENVSDLTKALRNYKAGDVVGITVYRGGREMNLRIKLDEKPSTVQPG